MDTAPSESIPSSEDAAASAEPASVEQSATDTSQLSEVTTSDDKTVASEAAMETQDGAEPPAEEPRKRVRKSRFDQPEERNNQVDQPEERNNRVDEERKRKHSASPDK